MAKIHINNPKQVINGGAKKYYFKVKGLGGPKGDKGDKGDTGATGPEGPQGNAATVSIGSTTTLPVGYDATVTNSGSIYNAVLNFGIPQGPRGPQGATGAKGDKGDKGDQGNPGPQGEKGTNATVYVGTTSTLNPGSQATVYNSGTDSNAVLNFGIPKGEKGDTGPMPTIAQTTGQAIDQVMSQKATTDALNTKQATITNSNKLSADLVTDSTTTNKFVTAEDKTTWNAKQNALTAGTGIDITGGVISTPAIVPEVVAELPTTGAEGKLYLTPKAHTTSTATGNPIEATITAQAGQLESFQLDGDTFQQTYTGKNLFNKDSANVLVAYIDAVVSVITANSQNRLIWVPCEPNTTYTVSRQRTSGGQKQLAYTTQEPAVGVQVYGKVNWAADSTECSITTGEDARYIVVRIWQEVQESDISLDNLLKLVQIEKSSSATDYEPFVGGQPSPSPEYPQQIQTVTGLQTISINGSDYPIDLGSIELCKLGTYQDYIYKDGEDWKVHKETKRISVDGSQRSGNITQYGFAQIRIDSEALYVSAPPVSYCSNLPSHDIYDSLPKTYAIRSSSTQCNFRLYFTPQLENFADYLDWCAENKPSVVAPLQQSDHTDTTITDTNLIAQLEAIRTASLENGTNTISNSATGSNLAGDMEIGYYGFNPNNRYDKWLWLDINNNYEKLGS